MDILDELKKLNSFINTYQSGDLLKQIDIKNSILSLIEKIKSIDSINNLSFIQSIIKILEEKCKNKFFEEEILFIKELFNLIINIIEKKLKYKEFINLLDNLDDKFSNLFTKESYKEFIDTIGENILKIDIESKNNKLNEQNEQIIIDDLVDDSALLAQFASEAADQLDSAQFNLVDLEHDPSNKNSLDTVFRAFHTIKGSSAFLGLKPIELVSHSMEDLFSLIRDGKITITRDLIDFIFIGINLLHTFLGFMKISSYDPAILKNDLLKIKIDDYLFYIKKIKEQYQVKKIGEILKDLKILNERQLNEVLQIQSLEKENKKIGEILLEKQIVSEDQLLEAINLQQKQKEKVKKLSFVKVSNEKLNTLIDRVGELVINQSILRQEILSIKGISDNLERSLSQLEIITTGIKNLVLSMGMISISEIFNRLRVVARNTASEVGKSISTEIEGEDTELDRNIVEMLYDPLMHLVRNAIDHGIEDVETRKLKNKPLIGKIFISASNKGSNIEIIVSDDGRGIDKQKIIEKAIEKNLIEKDKAQNLTEKEIYSFIFMPGFSTTDKISKVSGRGVGLDVVKKNIEQIHGRIDIQSESSKFTKFIIRIPLTLAIIEGFVTKVENNFYVFPFSQIEEILVIEKSSNKFSKNGNQDFFYHREMHIPVIYARKIFAENCFKYKDEKIIKERNFGIILSVDQSRYCIIVDEVIGKQEIVIKNLGELLSSFKYFSGGTIFGDGTIGFVVDTQALIENYI
ncbi:MAG: chemotaxis protein CheA [Exilispira sp.]